MVTKAKKRFFTEEENNQLQTLKLDTKQKLGTAGQLSNNLQKIADLCRARGDNKTANRIETVANGLDNSLREIKDVLMYNV